MNNNASLGIKKAKINAQKKRNLSSMNYQKVINVNDPTLRDIETRDIAQSIKRTGINTETAMSNSVIPSDH